MTGRRADQRTEKVTHRGMSYSSAQKHRKSAGFQDSFDFFSIIRFQKGLGKFQTYFKNTSRNLQGCFKSVFRVFQGSLKDVLRLFSRSYQHFSWHRWTNALHYCCNIHICVECVEVAWWWHCLHPLHVLPFCFAPFTFRANPRITNSW